MSLRYVTSGKLPRLPRYVCSYRQLKTKLLPILTWVLSLFLLAAPASAVYTPASPAELLAAVKPVTPVATPFSDSNQSQTTNNSASTTDSTAAASASAPTHLTADAVSQKTPEIVIEITAAEYIPPAAPITEQSPGKFPYGQCTYYVATRRNVTWSGNAGQWYQNAQAAGRSVGQTPAVGAIMVTWESPLGHVAYVESVGADGSFVISEMNNRGSAGWGKVDTRTVIPGSVPLIGFIY